MKLKISVDPIMCFGASACVTVSPDHFALNNDAKAVVLDNGETAKIDSRVYERIIEADDAKKDEIILAAKSCPVAAISVWNADTGEKLYP
jgi:ferredoxin